jgi:hypothetical protein
LGVRLCIQCRRAFNAQWAQDNPEKALKRTTNWRRRWRRANPEQAKETDFRRALAKRGLTVESYEARLESQSGVCDVCQKPPLPGKRLHVDHDHETGVIRGLLHSLCNRALGFLGDDPHTMELAAEYLRKHQSRKVV